MDKKERSKSETTGFKNFYFGQKLVKRSSFHGHKFYVNFEHVLWIFHTPCLSLVWAHIFCDYFFCAPKWRKNIKEIKGKSQRIPKNIDSPKIDKKERSKSEKTGFWKFLFWPRTGHEILFSSSLAFCQFWACLLNFPQATPFTCLSSYFSWLLLLCS